MGLILSSCNSVNENNPNNYSHDASSDAISSTSEIEFSADENNVEINEGVELKFAQLLNSVERRFDASSKITAKIQIDSLLGLELTYYHGEVYSIPILGELNYDAIKLVGSDYLFYAGWGFPDSVFPNAVWDVSDTASNYRDDTRVREIISFAYLDSSNYLINRNEKYQISLP